MYNNAERIRVPLIATGGSTSTEFFLIRVKGNDVPFPSPPTLTLDATNAKCYADR
ncbi:MAG: hypothetical protein ACK55Z_12620 [bacterium]